MVSLTGFHLRTAIPKAQTTLEITVYCNAPLGREQRLLPAAQYNLARLLQSRSPNGVAFVPIRSMQMLAILDKEEFVFLDNQYRSWVEIAWRGFHPQCRTSLDESVPYETVFFHPDGRNNLDRLLAEFPKALRALAGKSRIEGPAKLLTFEGHVRSEPT